MNYEPSETSFNNDNGFKQINIPKGNFQNKPQDCSPLLRTFSSNSLHNNGSVNHQNRNNSNQRYKTPIRNRLGNRNFQHNRNNNVGDNIQSQQPPRIYNRKRNNMNETNIGQTQPKRKWVKKNYHNNQQNFNSAQSRLDKIKNDASGSTENIVKCENDSQEIDATDITVEVVNHTAHLHEDNNITRFKMILDPKVQAAVKLIQSKRKDKQVIFPFPVTPNCTEISIHERFSLL